MSDIQLALVCGYIIGFIPYCIGIARDIHFDVVKKTGEEKYAESFGWGAFFGAFWPILFAIWVAGQIGKLMVIRPPEDVKRARRKHLEAKSDEAEKALDDANATSG